ncbi:MAG: hypothetical protein ABH864_02805 [archaeon]
MRSRRDTIAKKLSIGELAKKEWSTGEFYHVLFDYLKTKAKPERTSEMITRFFGRNSSEEKPYFPGGVELASFINSLYEVRWFDPERKYACVDMQSLVNVIAESWGLNWLEVVVTQDVNVVAEAADNKGWWDYFFDAGVEHEAVYSAGLAAECAVSSILNSRVTCNSEDKLDVVRYAAIAAASRAAEIVAQSLDPNFPNRFGSMMEIYKEGFGPVIISQNANEGNKLIIQQPLVNRRRVAV